MKNSTFHFVFLGKIESLPFDTGSLSNLGDQTGWEPKAVVSLILRMSAISNAH